MYSLQLQGNRFTLRQHGHLAPAPDDFHDLAPHYDGDGVVFSAHNVVAYATVVDADAARWRAVDRKKLHNVIIRRKMITEFSRRSRFRLLKLANSLDQAASGVMLTLTYKTLMVDHAASKHHLELMLLYLKRKYPHTAALWRMEYQQRGAIHYHVMLLSWDSVWIDVNAARARWREIVAEPAAVNVRWIDSGKRALAYVSKYVAKVAQAVQAGATTPAAEQQGAFNLDNGTYSDTGQPEAFVGRFWGISNRRVLPLAPLVELGVPDHLFCEIVEVRRLVSSLCRSKSRRMRGKHPKLAQFLHRMAHRVTHTRQGFTLFVDASQVLAWIRRYTIIENVTKSLTNSKVVV